MTTSSWYDWTIACQSDVEQSALPNHLVGSLFLAFFSSSGSAGKQPDIQGGHCDYFQHLGIAAISVSLFLIWCCSFVASFFQAQLQNSSHWMVKITLQIACAHPPAAKVSSSGDSVSLIAGWNSPFSSRMCEGFFEENSLLIFHQFFEASTQGFMSRAGKGPGRKHSGQTKRPLSKGGLKLSGFSGIPFVQYLSSRSKV